MRAGRARLLASLALSTVAGCGISVVGVAPGDVDPLGDAAADARPSRDADQNPQDGAAVEDGGVVRDATDEDATVDAGPPRVLAFVQSAPGKTTASSYTFSVMPTKPGSFIAVVVSANDGATTNVVSVGDNAAGGTNAYTSAGVKSVASGCAGTDIWYARDTRPATEIKVTLNVSKTMQLWFLEVSGLPPASGTITQHTSNGAGTTMPAASFAVSSPPALFVAGIASCASVRVPAAQNPIQSLGEQDGNVAGYFIANAAGTWELGWANDNTGWTRSIAIFY